MRDVYVITGICGHLGNNIASMLAKDGVELRGLALPGEDSSMLPEGVKLTRGNVCDIGSMEPMFSDIGGANVTVIHAAGLISISRKNDNAIFDVNVGGTKNVVALCAKHCVEKLVYVSSTHAIPVLPQGMVMDEVNKFSPSLVEGAYSKSKAIASQFVLDEAAKTGLNASIVHPAGMVGPNDYGKGFLTEVISDYIKGTLRACVPGGYDFADVRDVASGIISTARKGGKGECYILSGSYYPVLDLLDITHELTGVKAISTILPIRFVKACVPLAIAYFKLKKEKPLLTRDSLIILESNSAFSNEKAKRELGFTTRGIRDTISDTVDFLRRQRRIPAGV